MDYGTVEKMLRDKEENFVYENQGGGGMNQNFQDWINENVARDGNTYPNPSIKSAFLSRSHNPRPACERENSIGQEDDDCHQTTP